MGKLDGKIALVTGGSSALYEVPGENISFGHGEAQRART